MAEPTYRVFADLKNHADLHFDGVTRVSMSNPGGHWVVFQRGKATYIHSDLILVLSMTSESLPTDQIVIEGAP